MAEWIKILIAVVVGGIITGVFGLVVEHLRHRWKMGERYQQLLAEERLSSCDKLVGMLIEFDNDLSPIQYGVEPLRWPKDRRITSNPTEEQIEHAKRIQQRIADLSHFVATHEMVLGPKVVSTWNKYYGALNYLRSRIITRAGTGMNDIAAEALEKLMTEFIDQICKSVRDQLRGAGVEFVPTSKMRELRREGRERIEELLKEAEAEIEDITGHGEQ